VIAEAAVTFTGIWLLTGHLTEQTKRRIAGRAALVDVCLHASIVILFHRTFAGLMQAEMAGIMVTMYMRTWRKWYGYEYRKAGRWVRVLGTRSGVPFNWRAKLLGE